MIHISLRRCVGVIQLIHVAKPDKIIIKVWNKNIKHFLLDVI